jgi:hypothetical protein
MRDNWDSLRSFMEMVFQPRKIDRSGLWRAFDDNVLIYVQKQKELEAVECYYPYVLIEGKLVILDAAKKVWRERVTTRAADVAIEHISDLMRYDLPGPQRS